MFDRDTLLARLDTIDGYDWQERCRAWRTHETCGESVYQVYMFVRDISRISLEEVDQHISKVPPMFLAKTEPIAPADSGLFKHKSEAFGDIKETQPYDQSQRWDSAIPGDPTDLKFSRIIRATRTIRLNGEEPSAEN